MGVVTCNVIHEHSAIMNSVARYCSGFWCEHNWTCTLLYH